MASNVSINRQDAEDFLYREAQLLDEHRYEEWLKLFTTDGYYWIPMDENADPELEPSILYDDAKMREQRVYQLVYQPHYAQLPPSRTTHLISNVTVDNNDSDGPVLVKCNFAVYELREGDHLQRGLGDQRVLSGRCEYHLHKNEKLEIALKKVILINRDLPIFNLSFIL